MAAQVALALSQLTMVVATWRGEGGTALAALVCTNLIYWASLPLILLRHRLYTRHRLAMLIAVRTLPGLLPNARSPTVGTAVMLQRPPTPGARGEIADLLRLCTGAWQGCWRHGHAAAGHLGSLRAALFACGRGACPCLPPARTPAGIRALPYAIVRCTLGVPALIALLNGLLATALCWNAAGYCSTPLLAQPLGRRRLLATAGTFELAFSSLSAAYPLAAQLVQQPPSELDGEQLWGGQQAAGRQHLRSLASEQLPAPTRRSLPRPATLPRPAGEQSDVVCRATASFLHIAVGVLAPTFVAAYSAAAIPGGGDGGAAEPRLQRWAARADKWLRAAMAADGPFAQRAAAAWFIAGNLWLACRLWWGML